MQILENFLERDNWQFELLMIPIVLTYLSLALFLLTEAGDSSQFFNAAEIVVSSFLSFLLVVLYFRQNSILETQADIQEEQTDILRASETPDVVMNRFLIFPREGSGESNVIGAKFSNTGDGLAKNFQVNTKLDLSNGSKLSGSTFPSGLKRDENSDIRGLAGDYLRGGELGKHLKSELRLQIVNKPVDGEEGWRRKTLDFEEAVELLTDHGVDSITIVWEFVWTDTFGRSEDAYDNEYQDQYFQTGDIEAGMTFAEFMGVSDIERERNASAGEE